MRNLVTGHTNHDLLSKGPGHGWVQNLRQGDGNDDKWGTYEGDHDLETGPLQCSYVQVAPAAPHRLKGKWGSGEGGHSLPRL